MIFVDQTKKTQILYSASVTFRSRNRRVQIHTVDTKSCRDKLLYDVSQIRYRKKTKFVDGWRVTCLGRWNTSTQTPIIYSILLHMRTGPHFRQVLWAGLKADTLFHLSPIIPPALRSYNNVFLIFFQFTVLLRYLCRRRTVVVAAIMNYWCSHCTVLSVPLGCIRCRKNNWRVRETLRKQRAAKYI